MQGSLPEQKQCTFTVLSTAANSNQIAGDGSLGGQFSRYQTPDVETVDIPVGIKHIYELVYAFFAGCLDLLLQNFWCLLAILRAQNQGYSSPIAHFGNFPLGPIGVKIATCR